MEESNWRGLALSGLSMEVLFDLGHDRKGEEF